MSRRTWYTDAQTTSQGIVFADFSFVTNDVANPNAQWFRGCGGLSGANNSQQVGNSGPSAIASIVRTGVGAFLVTFADGYRFVQAADASMNDAADAFQAKVGAISNEGAGHTTPVTMVVQVRNGAAAQETTGRRISVFAVLKNSGNGS